MQAQGNNRMFYRIRQLAVRGLAYALSFALAIMGAHAQEGPKLNATSWLLVDVTSGQILDAQQPDEHVEPASLTKLMTAYLVFTAFREATLSLDQRPPLFDRAY